MGMFLSTDKRRSVTRMRQDEGKRTMQRLSRRTGVSYSALEELHYVFLKQQPLGFITRHEFVAQNADAHGGSRQMWGRMFDLLAADSDDLDVVLEDDDVGYPKLTFEFMVLRMYEHQATAVPTERVIRRVFRFLDLSSDGVLDLEELTTGIEWLFELSEATKLRTNPEIVARFAAVGEEGGVHASVLSPALDEDGNALPFTIEELGEIAPQISSAEERAQALILQMDVDGDGCLSEPEFIEGCRADQFLVELFSFATPIF